MPRELEWQSPGLQNQFVRVQVPTAVPSVQDLGSSPRLFGVGVIGNTAHKGNLGSNPSPSLMGSLMVERLLMRIMPL